MFKKFPYDANGWNGSKGEILIQPDAVAYVKRYPSQMTKKLITTVVFDDVTWIDFEGEAGREVWDWFIKQELT